MIEGGRKRDLDKLDMTKCDWSEVVTVGRASKVMG